MTTHELANRLLEGPNLPVEVGVHGNIGEGGDWDALWGAPVHINYTQEGKVQLIAEVAEEYETNDTDD